MPTTTFHAPFDRIVKCSLPGRAVASMAAVGGQLWLIVDPEKPDILSHIGALLAQVSGG